MSAPQSSFNHQHQAIRDLRNWRRHVGSAIRRLRVERKMTIGVLAEISNVGVERLDLYELGRGDIHPHHIARIAAALRVGFGDLI